MNEAERELLYRKAMDNWNEGHLENALSCMNELVEANQGVPRVIATFCALRGNIHKDLGNTRAARRDFKFSLKIKPKSRLASAWYYNFLVESGQMQEANKEGLRYLTAIDDTPELAADTLCYVETILANLNDTPGWCEQLQSRDFEIINKRWEQLYNSKWTPTHAATKTQRRGV